MSLKLHTAAGQGWAEGTVFEHGSVRLMLLDGVPIEAPLEGTLIVIRNQDQPGVIGEVGTILGRHSLNIANFSLGRNESGAVGVVNVDERRSGAHPTEVEVTDRVLEEIRGARAVRDAHVVRF